MIYFIGNRRDLDIYCQEHDLHPRDRKSMRHIGRAAHTRGILLKPEDEVVIGHPHDWDAYMSMRFTAKASGHPFGA